MGGTLRDSLRYYFCPKGNYVSLWRHKINSYEKIKIQEFRVTDVRVMKSAKNEKYGFKAITNVILDIKGNDIRFVLLI